MGVAGSFETDRFNMIFRIFRIRIIKS